MFIYYKLSLREMMKGFLNFFIVFAFLFLANCTTNNNSQNIVDKTPQAQDPWENFNRGTFAFNKVFDKYLLAPLAKGYRIILPDEAREEVRNFFRDN